MQIGDLLCAVPALRALRASLPEAEITLVGLPWAREFASRFERYVDAFLEFAGFPGLPEQPARVRELPAFLELAHAKRFDLALQLHGSGGVSNLIALLLGARETAGFYAPGQFCPNPEWFMPYPEDVHEIHRLLALLNFLGIPGQGDDLEFPLRATDREELAVASGGAALQSGRYVCLHPGGSCEARRWHPSKFARVGDWLASRGWRVVLTGSRNERALVREVAKAMVAPALDLAGKTSLGGMAALVAGSRLVICNDTSVSHLAAALSVPSVVVVLASDPVRWAPLDRKLHRVVRQPVACSPCAHAICPLDLACERGLPAEVVIDTVRSLLDGEQAHAA